MSEELKPCRFDVEGAPADTCQEHMSRERLVRSDICEEVYWNKRHLWENRRASSASKDKVVEGLRDRITEYLSLGGFFNPEMMDHKKVRDLLIDIRDALARLTPGKEGR